MRSDDQNKLLIEDSSSLTVDGPHGDDAATLTFDIRKPDLAATIKAHLENKKRLTIPQGVRAIVYSFLSVHFLMDTIANLSKGERKLLVNRKIADELLIQPRSLMIDMSYDEGSIQIDNFEYLIQLSNELLF